MKYQKSDRNDFSDLSQRISRCPDAGKAVDDLKNDGSQKDHAKRNQQQADEDIRCKNIMRESQRICIGIENAGEKKQNGKCADENQRLFFGSFFFPENGVSHTAGREDQYPERQRFFPAYRDPDLNVRFHNWILSAL